jgi:Recombinase zinc beta ribbon domain/Recombinase
MASCASSPTSSSPCPGTSGRRHWGPLSLSRLLALLHNPTYTGAYVYGRRRSPPVVVAGQGVRIRPRQRLQAQWMVVIQDAHPVYLSWEDYLENHRQLTRTRTDLSSQDRQGAPRAGAALLPGLLLCGRCGRRMTVRYHGPKGQRAADQCDRRRFQDGQGGMCWSVPAPPIDAAVDTHVLEALTPANLDLALAVLHQMAVDARELDRHGQLQLERARDEAQRAARQFEAVDPENRLVARTLARRRNEKRQQGEALEQADAEAQRMQRLEGSPQERQQILRLAADLPAVWQAPTTTPADRQELLSLLVKPIALTPVEGSPRQTQVQGLWHTNATTALWGPRPSTRDRLRTPSAVVATIATLAAGSTDDAIAAVLNARGLHSGRGQPVTAAAVAWIRYQYQIRNPGSDLRMAARLEARPDGRYSPRALALHLGVTISTVHDWREHGIMPAIQETPGGPWWHSVTPAVLAALRQPSRRVSLRPDALGIPHAH